MGARDLIWLLTKKLPGQIWRRARELWAKAVAFVRARRKLALLGLGGVVLILGLGLILGALGQSRARAIRERARSGELAETFRPLPIAPEEFFFPEEPDALPEFIPARPQREAWTEGDAAGYWTDPLAEREGLWRERFGDAVEDMLEAVP